MSARARRRLAISSAIVCVLTVAAGLFGSWLLDTEPGAKWGFERLGAILPGKLEVKELHGPLRGPLEARKVTYRTDRAEITIDRLMLHWRLSWLLGRRLEIDRLYAYNVRWLVGKSGERPEQRDSLSGPLPDVNLPVSIVVHDGLIDHLQITPSAADSGLLIDRVTLDARNLRDSLHVRRLVVRSRPIDLEFTGTARPRGAYPLSLRGRWAYRPRGGMTIAGEGTFVGNLDTLRVIQDLTQPFAGHLDAYFYRALRGQMKFLTDLELKDLNPRALRSSLPEGRYAGHVHAEGELDRFAANGTIEGTGPDVGRSRSEFHLQQAAGTWQIQDLKVSLPETRTTLQAQGTVTNDSSGTRFALGTTWSGLDWPLRGEPMVRSERGKGRLEGSPESFAVRLEALLAGRSMPPGRWTLDGRGGNGRIAIRTVIADLLDGRVVGTGSVAWQPRASWRLDFQGKNIDPGAAWKAWPGRLAFAGRSDGRMDPAGPSGRVLISQLEGTLRRQPISGKADLVARQGQYTLGPTSFVWGPNHAEASGSFGHAWSLDWKLTAPALASVLPEGSGSLAGHGSIHGPSARPHVIAVLSGDSIYVGRTHAGTLRADADVDLKPGGAVRVEIAATQVDAGPRSAQRLLLTANGTREHHDLRASIAGRRDSTVTVLSGGYADRTWRGVIRNLDLVHSRAGKWSLVAPAPLFAEPDHIDLTGFTWGSGPSRLALTADWRRHGGWNIDSHCTAVELALFNPFLPYELQLKGPMNGHVVARATDVGQLYADVDLTPGPGDLSYLDASGKWTPVHFQNARVNIDADGHRLDGDLRADLVKVGTVRGSIALPAYGIDTNAARAPISGHLALHLKDLAVAQGFSRDLDATKGVLDADLAFGGTVAHPTLSGPLHLKDGQANVPPLGLELRDIRVDATGAAGGHLALEGSLVSGPGKLDFKGSASLSGAKPKAELHVVGQRVQALNTHESHVLISPDLKLALDGKRLDVTGDVAIPEGLIDYDPPTGPRVVKPSTDVVYGGTDTLNESALEVHTRVKVKVGDRLNVHALGLVIVPTGTVIATDEPGLPTLGSGELDVKDGTYRIYGQELAIDQGRLIFGGGPIANPAIVARASRKASDGVIAGFTVSGTLQKPDVRVFSQPAMGESQALSYVLFGRPLDQGSLSQGQLASTMATNLGIRGSNIAAHGLASQVGIQSAQIEAGKDNAFQNAALQLGTSLSPKLYVGYGVGLFESMSALRMRYLLSSRWTIEAETSQQNRVDILYTVEK